MVEQDNHNLETGINENASAKSLDEISGFRIPTEVFNTKEGREQFRERIEEGLRTYSKVVRDEQPIHLRPEFQWPEGFEKIVFRAKI